ncbi:terminase small subunit [Nguyenibacter vanlangensis]|uniref:Terminase small subunit n=1 Tax=Nguyenibacter vanlangensis TaxID=1216886 RepID=A0ABZ3D1Q3_9PROT
MAKNSGGKLVNRQELAEILGVSLPTVTAWVRQKMPYVQRGSQGVDWQFDTAAVIQWRADRAADAAGGVLDSADEIERQIALVQLEHARLKFARDAALVVPVDQLERRLSIVFAEIRTAMRNIPSRTAAMLLGETSERQFKKVLSEEIDRALTALSEYDTNLLDESLEDDQSEQPE